MITLTQLRYIIAVDTYKHFANAADKCMVTQHTLSMQIKKLEDNLGIVIFDRSKQPIMTTDIGHIIIGQAREIIKKAEKLENVAVSYHRDISGSLKIGVMPTVAPYLVPLFLGKMVRSHPSVKLTIKELKTDDIIMQLRKDEIDVGIMATPTHEEDITEDALFYEEIKVYTQFGHPLTKDKSVTLKEISKRKDVWMLTDGNCFKNQVINLCKNQFESHENEAIQYESGSLETLIKLVEAEGGITFLPELAMLELSIRQMRQVISISDIRPLREISVCYVRDIAKRDLINLLSEVIKNVVPAELLDKSRGKIVEWK
ncbi:MAG: LysR substrate-binding domain-containing protein [Chitinophagales bacterium]|nr:LysR substrate-binding domain-containing protein [Chitinophagales bacterium]